MRILHVIPELADYNGGPPQALATLARVQAAAGDDVTVLPCRITQGPQTLPAGRDGRLLVCEGVTHGRLLWYDARLKRALRELIRSTDIVHVHGTWRYHLLGTAAAAREAGKPFLIRPYGNLGLAPRRHKALLKMPYFALIERPAVNRAAAIHCCSQKEQSELADLNLKPRTFVIPLPIEIALTQATPDFDALHAHCPALSNRNLKTVVFLGRIARIKLLDRLIAAFAALSASHPDWLLVLAGPHYEPETAQALAAQAYNAGLSDRVLMPGMIRDRAKAALLTRADIFAQPSAHENFGISLAEALLFGKPSVVSDGVAIADDVRTANAGIVCKPEIAPLRDALANLMNDPERRKSCGAAARQLVQRFTPATVAAQLRAEYERCLAAR